jgi:putative addiction module antidote
MIALRLRKIGKSIGIILPNEMLVRLGAKEGEEVIAIETPTGYALTTPDPRVLKQIKAGEKLMESSHEVFIGLKDR